MKASVTRPTLLAAYGVAIVADFIQMGAFSATTWGFLSPPDDFLDVCTCVILTYLLGWHIAFLPSFMFKLIPIADLAPTWTLAVFFATRRYRKATTPAAAPPVMGASDKAKVVDVEAEEVKPPKL